MNEPTASEGDWAGAGGGPDPAMHADRRRAESFGAQADRYDRARPDYPPALFEAVLGPAPAGVEVLDVGCGTGIAARAMARRGARVLGVEIDPRMAEVARRHGLEVEVAAFESWEDGGRRFDRVTAAQSWHWVDPVAGAARAAAVLREGGRLCTFWNVAEQPPELRDALEAVYRRLAPQAGLHPTLVGRVAATSSAGPGPNPGHPPRFSRELEGMRACSQLAEPVISSYPWRRRYSREEWLEQLPTHSDHATMPAEALGRLLEAVGRVLDEHGGSFEMSYATWLLSADRR